MVEIRGLGKKQRSQIIATNKKILRFIHSRQPVSLTQIEKKSDVNDRRTIQKRLDILLKSKQIHRVSLTCIPEYRKGWYYFAIPKNNKINELLKEEKFFQDLKIRKRYYYGLIGRNHLPLQYSHKLRMLISQLPTIRKIEERISRKNRYHQPFEEQIFLGNSSKYIEGFKKIQKEPLLKNDQIFQISAIEVLDRFAMRYDLAGTFVSERLTYLQKFAILQMYLTSSSYKIAKKFHCSNKLIENIQKEFVMKNGHVDEVKVTELHNHLFGEKTYMIKNKKSTFNSKNQLHVPKFRTRKEQFLHSITPETEYVSYGQYFNWLWLKNKK